jgi:hypothetical protein
MCATRRIITDRSTGCLYREASPSLPERAMEFSRKRLTNYTVDAIVRLRAAQALGVS